MAPLSLRNAISLILLFLSFQNYAQSQKVKFGHVSLEDLQMTTYLNDTTADAVILYDQGHFTANDFTFTRHIRVKILKQSGTSWGNWTINTPSKGDISAFTFNLRNNEIIREKLDKGSIYKEQILNNFYVHKVFVPNVTVGTVIDITYSHIGLPREWRFQERIPTVYSKLILEPSKFVSYRKTFLGFEPIETISSNEWKAENIPAFKIEPYLNSYSNYITKFQFQIVSFNAFGYTNYISSSWLHINKLLLDYDRFGGIINSNFLNKPAKEINAKVEGLEEKINHAYDYIRSSIKWNQNTTLIGTSQSKNNFFTTHTSNSAEINLLLIALLEKMGIKTYPVVLSTRDNGFLIQYSPSLDQLNYVVAYINHEGIEMFLDATSDNLMPGILPSKCLNGQGLLVHRDHALWVDLNLGKINRKRQFIKIDINKNATGLAKLTQQYKDYAYLEWLNILEKNEGEKKYIQYLEEKYASIIINKYDLKEKNKTELKANEFFEVDLSKNIIDLGNEIIFNPFIMSDYYENPFKSESRNYPVDLFYPSEYSSTIVVDVPNEYKIKSLPKSESMKIESGGANFSLLANSIGNIIELKVIIKIERSIFTEKEYLELRQFYSLVIKKMNEYVVLSKNI